MTDTLAQVIRELSEVYDEDSNDTFVSLYIHKKDNKFINTRKRTCVSLLKGAERKNFLQTMDTIEDTLKKQASPDQAIFASHTYDFLRTIALPLAVENSLVVDSSPYIRPLARIQDEWESFTLVLLDSHSAKIFSLSLGNVERSKSLSKDIMNKHKKGGCSQARFQRLRRGAIHAFHTEVAEALGKMADDQIVLAGPGQAKLAFQEMLPKDLKERIIDVLDIDIDAEQELLKEAIHRVSEHEEQKSYKAVEHLKTEILKDGLAIYGIAETLQAVKNGQVELLLIEKDYKQRGWICENCQIVETGSTARCPYCNGTTSQVDMLEEIIEFAERTDAAIEFTSDENLAALGHVGGLLRFK